MRVFILLNREERLSIRSRTPGKGNAGQNGNMNWEEKRGQTLSNSRETRSDRQYTERGL